MSPKEGLRAADEAVIVREMARGVAFRLGHRVTFTPVLDLNVAGSGMHIHFSLRDAADKPIMYDPKRAYGLSKAAEPFIAGI